MNYYWSRPVKEEKPKETTVTFNTKQVDKTTDDKVACQYCDKKYSNRGIANHEKACKENPINREGNK